MEKYCKVRCLEVSIDLNVGFERQVGVEVVNVKRNPAVMIESAQWASVGKLTQWIVFGLIKK